MKKLFKQLLSLALPATMLFSFAACATPDVGDDDVSTEKIDDKRTQLYVNNFDGGYGADWLSAVKTRYEELHKDDVYEDGKQGIQIYINNKKEAASKLAASQILDNRDEVYFSEYSYYRTLKSDGVLLDITDAVTADLEAYGDPAGTTVESKLTAQQKEFYGIQENNETHYYGLPHYAGYSGIVYNVDLFDQKGYYFREGHEKYTDIEDIFILRDKDAVKSVGPDGEKGTSDDGLPATYDEFFQLLRCIQGGGDTAIAWNGANNPDYLSNLLQALVADFEGSEQMMLNYNLNGTANDLGKIVDGQFVKDSTSTAITSANGYELYRQQGKYEALKFLRELCVKENNKYHNNLAFNGGYSHMAAQEDFLKAGHDGGKTAPIAMLIEGIWWESEATNTFREMGEGYSKYDRNFAFMPLPKANAEKAEVNKTNGKDAKKNTLIDHIYSICFVKSNIAEWKKPIALDFIKFVHTNESLVEFTTITDTPKAFEYDMSENQLAKLSPFGRSVLELKAKSDVVYPYSTNPVYIQKQSAFATGSMYKSSSTKQWPATDFRDNNTTAESYFTSMGNYYLTDWKNIIA